MPGRREAGFREVLQWEVENILRFPVLELVAVLTGFTMASCGSIHVSSSSLGRVLSWDELAASLAPSMAFTIRLGDLYDMLTYVYSALTAFSVAYEAASGRLELLLSYPVSRGRVFLAKVTVCLLTPVVVFCLAGFASLALAYPGYLAFMAADLPLIALLAVSESAFIFSLAFAVALALREPIAAFLGSLIILQVVKGFSGQVVVQGVPLLPPEGVKWAASAFFSRMRPVAPGSYLGVFVTLFVSVVLLAASYTYFTRWFEPCRAG